MEKILKLMENKDVWLTSDTHFSHTNLVRGTTRWPMITEEQKNSVRDFDTVHEMNVAMTTNINNFVKEDDLLIHLGDWSFGGIEKIATFRKMIKCKNIVLVLGNHDKHILRNRDNVRNLFTEVIDDSMTIIINDKTFDLVHDPNTLKKKFNIPNSMLIHGHWHSKRERRFGDRSMDVGICGHPEFRPYKLDEVIFLLNK